MPAIADLIRHAPVPADQLAAELGVTVRTLKRYASADQAPPAARALLEIHAGRVPWPGGERLRYCRGALYYRDNPDGVPLAEIAAYALRLRELDAVWRELRQLRAAPAQYLLGL
jgi:hypothetical protein